MLKLTISRYARHHLPKYAVPVFIRIVKEMTPIHNNKQNKVPLRQEGVDPEKVHPDDKVLWIDQNGKGHSKYSQAVCLFRIKLELLIIKCPSSM